MYFVLYDTADKRGWLVDGASVLLHIVLTQLISGPYKHSNFNSGEFNHPEIDGGAGASLEALLDKGNQAMRVSEEVDSGSVEETVYKQHLFKDLVLKMWSDIEKVQAKYSKVVEPDGHRMENPFGLSLTGYDYTELTSFNRPMRLRAASVGSNAKSWLDFTKSISATTLFGHTFGELLRPKVDPEDVPICREWTEIPKGESYLAAPTSLLKDLRGRGHEDDGKMKLAQRWTLAIPKEGRCSAKCGGCKGTQSSARVHEPQDTESIFWSVYGRSRSHDVSVLQDAGGAVILGKTAKRSSPVKVGFHDQCASPSDFSEWPRTTHKIETPAKPCPQENSIPAQGQAQLSEEPGSISEILCHTQGSRNGSILTQTKQNRVLELQLSHEGSERGRKSKEKLVGSAEGMSIGESSRRSPWDTKPLPPRPDGS